MTLGGSLIGLIQRGAIGLLLVLAAWSVAPLAHAEGYDSLDGCTGSWQSQFGVQLLVLDCAPGYATEHDRLYMFARGKVDTRADWRSQISLENAVWVFDAGARGKASLIIDFHREGSALVADMFDDTDFNGEIRYGFERGYVRSMESRFPTMKVIAPDGWWVRDGRVNYNLHITVDGSVLASWGGELFRDWMITNGHPDVVIDVQGTPGSGRPRREIIQAQPDGMDDGGTYGIYRTLVMQNEADDEVTPETYILWPYLGYFGPVREYPDDMPRKPLSALPGAKYGIVKNYNTAFPPIQIDWEKAKIETIGEFVASRSRGRNWFIYSISRAGREGLTGADFENPFAFYNLAGVDDGYPDLQIRDQYFPPLDPFAPSTAGPNFHEIRYSWDQNHSSDPNRRGWTYKVGLIGHRPTVGTIDVGNNERIATVPYDQLPRWVMENPWEAADFVAYERPMWTTEGLYETCGIVNRPTYYSGQSTQRPSLTDLLTRTAVGSRCEFASQLNGSARLYLGAVDRKLHLLRAEAGQWSLPGTTGEGPEAQLLRYSALGGPYLDHWERLDNGVVVQTLTHRAGRLIYADTDGVSISRGPDEQAVFLADPPTDPTSWATLRSQLAAARPAGEGSDLQALFREHQQELVTLPGARIWDIRPEGVGFRAMLSLADPVPDTPLTRDRAPGTYVLTYSPASGFALRPPKPTVLSVSAPVIRGNAPATLSPTRVSVQLTNGGDHDRKAATVAFLIGPPGKVGRLAGSATVDVPANGQAAAEFTWIPSGPGDWEIQAVVSGLDAAASAATAARSAPPPAVDVTSLLLAQGLRPFTVGAMTASVTLVVSIGVGLGLVVLQVGARARGGNR